MPSPDSYTLTDSQWAKVQASPAYRGARGLAWPDKAAAALISHYRIDLQHCQCVPRAPPHNPRFFTKREAARLQGFPERLPLGGYEFYHQIGNAVTTPVVCVLAVALMAHLEQREDDGSGLAPALELVAEAMDHRRRTEFMHRLVQMPDGTHEAVADLMRAPSS